MPERSQLRAVLDTNVFVSGLMGVNSPPRQIVDAWLDGRLTLVTSLYLVDELAHVLSYPKITERIPLDESEVDAILAALLSQAEMAPGELELPGVTRDPKDDAVVACAVEGEADYIVSGDDDLLVLNVYKDVKIVTPRQFVEIMSKYDEGEI
jgi:hypothetical protein